MSRGDVEKKKNSSVNTYDTTQTEEDSWFYRPHTITLLALGGCILVYAAFSRDPMRDDTVGNIKYGMLGGGLVMVLFSVAQMRDGLFERPHKALWRMVMGITLLYWMLLVFILFQNLNDVRKWLNHIDASLGVPLPERSYATECDLYTPDHPTSSFNNLWNTLNDEFVIAHLLGWWMKMLVVRDVYLIWGLSVLFEIMEYTFEDILHNFRECWWDHFILDVLICNGIGIALGSWTCKYLRMKEYNWMGAPNGTVKSETSRGTKSQTSLKSMLRNVLSSFTPSSFEDYEWAVLSCPKRFCYMLGLIVCFEIVELNAFFLKALLWLPPPHFINLIRLTIWFFISLPAFREFYHFIVTPSCKKLGTMAWLSLAVMGTEMLICIKFRQVFVIQFPEHVKWGWLIFCGFLSAFFFFFFFVRRTPSSSSSSGGSKKRR